MLYNISSYSFRLKNDLNDLSGNNEKSLLKFLSEGFAEREGFEPAILSDVRKCQKPNAQGFPFLLWCFIVSHNIILSLLIRVHFRVRRFSLLIFVYTGLYNLLKRSIAFAFNSSTIAMYGFIAFISECPVHFIITSDGMPSCNAVTTKVRRPQCVVSNAHLGNTCSCRSCP